MYALKILIYMLIIFIRALIKFLFKYEIISCQPEFLYKYETALYTLEIPK